LLPHVKLALRNVLRHRRRSGLAFGAIAFGVVALVLAGGFIERIFVDFRESSIRSHLGHIQITRPGFRTGASADPFAYLLPDDRVLLRAVEAEPQVRLAAPRLFFNGLVSAGETTLSFIGEGVEPGKENALSDAMTISAGKGLADDDADGAILGEGLAANLGVKPGDTLVLLATTAKGGTNAVEVRVRGTFYTVTKAYDDVALRVLLPTAQRLLRVDGVHSWVLLLRDTDRTGTVLASLRSRLASQGVELTPWWDLADFYNKTVSLFSRQLGVVRFIVGLIIVLSISNTMIMSVLERTWEIGTSMALGIKRRDILLMFLAEGTLLGALGAACGLAIGAVLAVVLSAIGIPMPPPPGMSHGFIGGVLLTPALLLGAFAIAVGTTLAASIYPARKASRLPIVDALRHTG
jgi:putative ABC transport system permease protein